jgi:hypothetical protein
MINQMRTLGIAAIFTCLGATALAQGQLNFANDTTTRLTNGAGVNFPPAGSTTYKAGIYWGPAGAGENSLNLLPASSNGVTTTWSPFSGIFNGGTATFPTLGQIAVQIRVWGANYADYAAAILAGAPEGTVKSAVQLVTLGNPNSIPPGTPTSLVSPTGPGDTPFRWTIVPEPSSIALGLLGLGAIAWFRHRK